MPHNLAQLSRACAGEWVLEPVLAEFTLQSCPRIPTVRLCVLPNADTSCRAHAIVCCSLTSIIRPSITDGMPSRMKSHCHPFSPRAVMLIRPAANGAANTTLTTFASVTAVKGLVDLQNCRGATKGERRCVRSTSNPTGLFGLVKALWHVQDRETSCVASYPGGNQAADAFAEVACMQTATSSRHPNAAYMCLG